MIVASVSLLAAGLIGVTAPAPDVKPVNYNTLREISRAADAHVTRDPCYVRPYFACFDLGDRTVRISSRPLYRVLANRSCRTTVPRALAVFILAHEAGHAHGIYTESGANTYALRNFSRIAKRLHFRNVSGPPPVGYVTYLWTRRASRC